MMNRMLVALGVAFSICSVATAGDWVGFRGEGGSGASAESNLPVNWGVDSNLNWKLKLPGAVDASRCAGDSQRLPHIAPWR